MGLTGISTTNFTHRYARRAHKKHDSQLQTQMEGKTPLGVCLLYPCHTSGPEVFRVFFDAVHADTGHHKPAVRNTHIALPDRTLLPV